MEESLKEIDSSKSKKKSDILTGFFSGLGTCIVFGILAGVTNLFWPLFAIYVMAVLLFLHYKRKHIAIGLILALILSSIIPLFILFGGCHIGPG